MSRTYKHSAEVRARISAASKAAWAEKNADLRGLTPAQLQVYKTLRRKGCTREEALHEARRPRRQPLAEAAE